MVILALLVAACGAAGPGNSPSSSEPTAAPGTASASPATSVSPALAYPITVQDDGGVSVTIPSEPHRIVSLTPGTTETLFALGLGDRVVATDSASDFPDAAAPLPHVAAFGSLDVEQIVGLHADLVIAGGNGYTPPDGIARLRSLGIPVLVIYAPSVDRVVADIELVGRAAGHSAEGAALAVGMRRDLDALAAAVHNLPKPRVFYEIDATKEIYGPADNSFLAGMIELAGGDPITSGDPVQFQIPLERLIAANPQVIILGDAAFGTTPATVTGRSGWSVITAVKTDAIRVVDDKLITRPGPRLAAGLRSLILAIHPEAHLP